MTEPRFGLQEGRHGKAGHHMALKALLMAMAFSALATACGPAADRGSTEAEAQAGAAFVPVYPGATIKTQMTQETVGNEKGSLLVLETPDPVAGVAAFYDRHAQREGMIPNMIVDEDDSAIRIFANRPAAPGKPGREGGMVSISRNADDSLTSIVITSGRSALSEVTKIPDVVEVPMPME